MKNLIAGMLLLLVTGTAFTNARTTEEFVSTVTEISILLPGNIVIEGDELFVNTGSSGITTSQVKVYDSAQNLVLSFSGCYQSSCVYDVSNLTSGEYYVKVFTNAGNHTARVVKH